MQYFHFNRYGRSQPPLSEDSFHEEGSEFSSFPHDLEQSIPQTNRDKPIHTLDEGGGVTFKKKSLLYEANFWDVLSFGICVAMGNIFIAWGSGFNNGFWDFFFATVISSSCFICLFLCIAEIVSIVPFAGGAYALARVTAGPYLGFLVGCCESIGNIVFTFVAMMPLGTTITYMFDGDPKYEPLYWLLIYVVVIATEFAGRKVYFSFLRCVAFLSLVIIALYLIISIQALKVEKYIPDLLRTTYRGGMKEVLPLLPPAGWWYYGLEIMPMMSDEVKNAKVDSPRAIISAALIVTVLAFICMLFAFTQYPSYQDDGAFALHSLPLNSGFTNAFNISDQMATLLSYPGLYISNAIFIYGYGKQLCALGKSQLFPSILGRTLTDSNIPYVALVVGSLIGYTILIVLTQGYGYNYDSDLTNELFNVALLGSYFTFEILFISFIIFRYKYNNLKRSFNNPLGIISAVYGMIGFGFLSSSLIGFSTYQYKPIIYFVVFIGVCSLYYFLYGRHHQIFNEEEQSVMFLVYLLKVNQRNSKARRTKLKYQVRKNSNPVQRDSTNLSSPNNSISISSSQLGGLSQLVSSLRAHKVHVSSNPPDTNSLTEQVTPTDEISPMPEPIKEESNHLLDWHSSRLKLSLKESDQPEESQRIDPLCSL